MSGSGVMRSTELSPSSRRGIFAPTHFRAAAERRAPHGARSAPTQVPAWPLCSPKTIAATSGWRGEGRPRSPRRRL